MPHPPSREKLEPRPNHVFPLLGQVKAVLEEILERVTDEFNLPELMARVEEAILRATGRRTLTLRVRLAGPQLRCVGRAWLEGW